MTYEELLAFYEPKGILNSDKVALLSRYCEILLEENRHYNLTAIKEIPDVIEKHFHDCLLPTLDSHFVGENILDVGSGAGFPGLVWAIAFPERHFVLLDATAKRCRFLEKVVAELQLKNVEVVNCRAEEFTRRESFDLVTARAVSFLPVLLEITAPFVKQGGLVLAMKGSKAEEEIRDAKRAIETLHLKILSDSVSTLPNGDTRHNIFLVLKGQIDKKYPRSWAKITAKPL